MKRNIAFLHLGRLIRLVSFSRRRPSDLGGYSMGSGEAFAYSSETSKRNGMKYCIAFAVDSSVVPCIALPEHLFSHLRCACSVRALL